MRINIAEVGKMTDNVKVPCLVFYINPSWDHRAHKVSIALPDDWDTIEDKEGHAEELFNEWLNSQIEDSGWRFGREYVDELTDL